jgi:hypothetical protein
MKYLKSLKGIEMLKPFVRSALFISLIATTTSTLARENDVDFSTTHFFTQELDKNYAIKALTINSLFRWNYDSPVGTPVTINYAFSGSNFCGEERYCVDGVGRNWYQYEKDAVLSVLAEVSSFTGITFVERAKFTDTQSLDFLFNIHTGVGNSALSPPSSADTDYSFRQVDFSESTTMIYLNPDREFNYERLTEVDIDYKHDFARSKWIIAHEIGHVLGMYHPFSTENNPHPFPLSVDDAIKSNTVMAYSTARVSQETYEASNFRIYDVVALQHLYGKNVNKNTGDSLYEYDDTYDFHQTIIDADGVDTISVAKSERNNVIDLRGGKFSSIAPHFVGYHNWDLPEHLGRSHNSLSLDVDSVIENATGGNGDDILVANSVSNMLDGGNGVDTAMFAGNKADYTVEIINSYTVIVTSVANSEDVDNLTGFEFIQFADETVSLNKPPVVTLPETVTVRETLQAIIAVTVTDPENDVLTYTWTQVDGTEVTLVGADSLNVNFDAPSVDVEETITLQLVVSDGTNVVTNTIAVVVVPNNAPVITDVTADQTVDEGATVTINVTATDADSDTLTYRWVVNGATVTLTGDTTDTITFTAPDVTSDTTLTVEVFVSDGFDEVSSETRTVTVKNVEASTTTPTTEVKPTEEKSSGGAFGYLVLLLAGLRLFRR